MPTKRMSPNIKNRSAFQAMAEERYATITASGKTVPWAEMRHYLDRRIAGEKTSRPKPSRSSRAQG